MVGKELTWVAVLIILVALILLIVGLIAVQSAWTDKSRRTFANVFLCAGIAILFIGGMVAAVAAETRPALCQLPYSKQYIPVERLQPVTNQTIVLKPTPVI
jgi:hypothetical protein